MLESSTLQEYGGERKVRPTRLLHRILNVLCVLVSLVFAYSCYRWNSDSRLNNRILPNTICTIKRNFTYNLLDAKALFPGVDDSWNSFHKKYRLYLFRNNEQSSALLMGNPVLFVHGNKGSPHQVRFLANSLPDRDVFTVGFGDEMPAIYGGSLYDESQFINESITFIQNLYEARNITTSLRPMVLIGHSMGAIAINLAMSSNVHKFNTFQSVINVAAPLKPIYNVDNLLDKAYIQINENPINSTIKVFNVYAGSRDWLVMYAGKGDVSSNSNNCWTDDANWAYPDGSAFNHDEVIECQESVKALAEIISTDALLNSTKRPLMGVDDVIWNPSFTKLLFSKAKFTFKTSSLLKVPEVPLGFWQYYTQFKDQNGKDYKFDYVRVFDASHSQAFINKTDILIRFQDHGRGLMLQFYDKKDPSITIYLSVDLFGSLALFLRGHLNFIIATLIALCCISFRDSWLVANNDSGINTLILLRLPWILILFGIAEILMTFSFHRMFGKLFIILAIIATTKCMTFFLSKVGLFLFRRVVGPLKPVDVFVSFRNTKKIEWRIWHILFLAVISIFIPFSIGICLATLILVKYYIYRCYSGSESEIEVDACRRLVLLMTLFASLQAITSFAIFKDWIILYYSFRDAHPLSLAPYFVTVYAIITEKMKIQTKVSTWKIRGLKVILNGLTCFTLLCDCCMFWTLYLFGIFLIPFLIVYKI